MNEYYTVEYIANLYKVHPETVRRWARTKTVIAKKIGKKWFFPKENYDKADA